MKITGIDIGEYRQFKNIKFDFTYPADHEKAGQPLDKVCFIGQSGTGKTTLLNVIWDFLQIINDGSWLDTNRFDSSILNTTRYEAFKNSKIVSVSATINQRPIFFPSLVFDNNPVGSAHAAWINGNGITEYLKAIDKYAIFIKDAIAREADAFLADQREQLQNFSDFVKTTSQIEEDKATFQNRVDVAGSRKIVSLGEMTSLSTWQYLLKNIINYDSETPKFIVNLGTKAKEETEEAFKELKSWLAKNPRIEFQQKCLKPLLNKLFLEVDLVGEDGAYLALRTKEGTKIPNNTLSTGTRQLLATAIPLYKFDTTDTVILFDEPERSLFPDIQQILIDYYTSLAPEAQFFFATHSPIIASAFEPCERFILHFNENGEVEYHTGVAPEGDDPNDILSEDFGLNELMLSKGLEEYKRYRQLAMAIRAETNEEKKDQLIVERLELGNRYNFAGRYAQNK